MQVFGIFCDRGPSSFWYFCVTVHLLNLGIFVTADLRVSGILVWLQTCKFLSLLLWLQTCEFFLVFLWPRACELVVLLQNCWPKHFSNFCDQRLASFWHFFVTADLRVFYIFVWLRTCKFWHICDCRPASFWYFCVTADLQIFATFVVTADLQVFCSFFVTANLWVCGIFTKLLN